MTDISVIILVGKEELHIRRCLERLRDLNPQQVFIVESQKGDATHDLAIESAKKLGWQTVELKEDQNPPLDTHHSSLATELKEGEHPPLIPHHSSLITIFHDWPKLQSIQFNWSLDNLPIGGEWVLRLDADEYLTDEGIAWLRTNLDSIPKSANALEFTLERKFCGGVIRHGTNGIKMVRMFRRGRGRYAETVMDERIVFEGDPMPTPVVFFDDNINTMDWWREKHRGYAKREAQQAISSMQSGEWTDPRKAKYYKLPRYLRAFMYFAIRYFLKGGFLDGYAGWMWNFWQGLWYRCLVDYEIGRMRREKK